MKIFVTGATGFIGSAIVQDLLAAGHQVLGLARSDAGASALVAAGAAVERGDLGDPAGLARAAAASDGVIHCAFIHDFANLAAAGATDLAAVEAMGAALAGSDRPLVVTSGLAHFASGHITTEADAADPQARASHRIASEVATLALAGRGVRASVVRLPPSVHGDGDHGFVPALIAVARATGVAAYVGDGRNRWPAVHRLDAARLFRRAAESGAAGRCYHGVAEEGVAMADIAAVIGRRLGLPVAARSAAEAAAHFGWIGGFAAIDCPASSARTQAELDWRPTGPGLLADLDRPVYFAA